MVQFSTVSGQDVTKEQLEFSTEVEQINRTYREDFPLSLLEKPITPPSKKLTHSIRLHGILDPVKLERNEDKYNIIDGNRRILAAFTLKLETVPAYIYEKIGQWEQSADITLTSNHNREPNAIRDYDVISELTRRGYDPSSIARRTGIDISTIKKTNRLQALIPDFRDAYAQGWISESTAFALVSLHQNEQKALYKKFKDDGNKLTTKEVKETRRVQTAEAFESIELPDMPTLEFNWHEHVNQRLEEIGQIIPDSEKALKNWYLQGKNLLEAVTMTEALR